MYKVTVMSCLEEAASGAIKFASPFPSHYPMFASLLLTSHSSKFCSLQPGLHGGCASERNHRCQGDGAIPRGISYAMATKEGRVELVECLEITEYLHPCQQE